jgi:transposase
VRRPPAVAIGIDPAISDLVPRVHHAGDKLFVDYAGTKPTIVDPTTGEILAVELFVAARRYGVMSLRTVQG